MENTQKEKEKKVLIKAYSVDDADGDATIVLVYRNEAGEKITEFYPKAIVPYYITKDPNAIESKTTTMYLDQNKVIKKQATTGTLDSAIAHDVGMGFYIDRCKLTDKRAAKNIHKHPCVYGSDMDPVDYYISLFNAAYEMPAGFKFHKGYYDIENDIANYDSFPDPEKAPCPVNVISYLDDGKTLDFYCFILDDGSNPNVAAFKENEANFKQYMLDLIKNQDGLNLDSITFIYSPNELELLKAYYENINKCDPDFALAWNAEYDIRTMENRLKKFFPKNDRTSYKEIICDPKHKVTDEGIELPLSAYYVMNPKQALGERMDYYKVNSGINYVDQMQLYANIRKVETKKYSYALDNIAEDELGKHKLPFGPGETIRNVAYKNFRRFIEYNMRDVVLLKLLEDKGNDIDLLAAIGRETNTQACKAMKKTISLKNYSAKYAKEKGLIMSNNRNTSYGDDSYFKSIIPDIDGLDGLPTETKNQMRLKQAYGAFVANPNLNNENGIEVFANKASKWIYENVTDEDLASLYPSIITAFNIDSASLLGKYYLYDDKIKSRLVGKYGYDGLFDSKVGTSDDGEGDDEEEAKTKKKAAIENNDLSIHLVDSLISHDWDAVGEKFFGLPNSTQIIKNILGK